MSTDTTSDRSSRIARTGLTTIACTTGILALLTAPFLRTFSGAPYVASSKLARQTIRRFLREEARRRKQSRDDAPRLIDLGAGSGELILDAAEEGWVSKGAELNAWLVLAANFRVWNRGLSSNASVKWCDMWDMNVDDADVVTVFGVPSIMRRVGEKMEKEASHGCVVCCNGFEIPGWRGCKSGEVWFYYVDEQGKRTINIPSNTNTLNIKGGKGSTVSGNPHIS